MSGYVAVCLSEQLPLGGRFVWNAADRQLLILRNADGLFALDNRCPHRGGLFSEGEVEKGHIFCPLHAWCYALRTGKAFYPEGSSIDVFPVRESEGWVEVLLPSDFEKKEDARGSTSNEGKS